MGFLLLLVKVSAKTDWFVSEKFEFYNETPFFAILLGISFNTKCQSHHKKTKKKSLEQLGPLCQNRSVEEKKTCSLSHFTFVSLF